MMEGLGVDRLLWGAFILFRRFRAREAEPSAAANPARALDRGAGDFFLI
jgi:hypothetical protein